MAQLHHSADVQISAEIRPVNTCRAGQEILWPLVRGQELHWIIDDVNEDGLIARPMREGVKDILIVCAERYVAVVVSKVDERAAQQQAYNAQFQQMYNQTGTSSNSYGTASGWTFTG